MQYGVEYNIKSFVEGYCQVRTTENSLCSSIGREFREVKGLCLENRASV